jgi:hypothetical protein
VHTRFGWGKLLESDHLENLGMDRRIILKWGFKKSVRGVDGIDLAQDTYSSRAVVKTVMILWVP